MTIRYVRIRPQMPRDDAEKFFAGSAGFEWWIAKRLKAIRQQLRGDEVKGVNILALEFRPSGLKGLLPRNTWGFLLNVAYHCQDLDMDGMVPNDVATNLARLMPLAAAACRAAPWPQVRAVEAVLVPPLQEAERVDLARNVSQLIAYIDGPSSSRVGAKH